MMDRNKQTLNLIFKIKYLLAILITLAFVTRASALSDTSIIKNHLTAITKTPGFRTHDNVLQLNETADYIQSIFKLYSDSVSVQNFTVKKLGYKTDTALNVNCTPPIRKNFDPLQE